MPYMSYMPYLARRRAAPNYIKTCARLAPALALLLAGCAGLAETQTAAVAPSTPAAPPFSGETHRGEILLLPSRSPAGFDLILSQGPGAGGRVRLGAELSLPSGAQSNDKLPAIILIHGSGGISGRGLKYVDLFNGMGLATLRIDSFTGRGITSTVGDQTRVTESMMVADALNGLAFLAGRDDIDPQRIGIIGWSKGGGVSLLAAWDDVAQTLAGDARFAAHAAFYPPCFVDIQEIDLAPAPVRIFIGGDDQWTPAQPCYAFARRLSAKNVPTELTVYPGAEHSFDRADPAQNHPDGFNYANCEFSINRAGVLRDLKSGVILDAPEKLDQATAACAKKGTRTAPDPRAARSALIELRKFVARTLLAP